MKSKPLIEKTTIYNVIFVKLFRTTKKEYFNNWETMKVNDNRTFSRTVVPTFSNKTIQKVIKFQDCFRRKNNYAELLALILKI